MSNSFIELELYENSLIDNYKNIYPELINFSDISIISKSKFASHFNFFCRKCETIPILRFTKINKVIYLCKCKGSPKTILVKDIFNLLYYSELIDFENEKLKCYLHPEEKYSLYCEKCKKNICSKCASDCIEHKNRIKVLSLDKNIIDIIKYINEKIKEKKDKYIEFDINKFDFENDDNDCNIPKYKLISKKDNNNFDEANSKCHMIENESFKDDDVLIFQKENNDFMNNNDKTEIINIINKNNNEDLNDNIDNYIDLFAIILDDYQKYPNINLIETILNIEKFIIVNSGDYNELNLEYEFEKENIDNNKMELFGEIFVNNNREKCFLLIEGKIFELSRFINLSDIFDDKKNYKDWPIRLNVKLIENKKYLITDLSFIFNGISTLSSKSNFKDFNAKNINKMSYMFYNCTSMKELPDISKLNTSKVIDMSYMFFNCSSITHLPDLSNWNMENIIDISHMFENCESLTSLPDISKWNTNNIKNFDDLFKNCKSLTILPNLSKWNIIKYIGNKNVFEGCKTLEEKKIKNNHIFLIIFNFLNNITNSCGKFCTIILIFIISLSLIYLFAAFCYEIFAPFYYCFHLENINNYVSSPIKHFNLIEYTNVSYISQILNITNSKEINIIDANKEAFINKEINFTFINGNIKFESVEKKIKINNILHIIFCPLKFIIIILIQFKKKISFIKTYIFYFLTIIIISNIISLIIEVIDLFEISNINNSLEFFKNKIKLLFRIDIPEFFRNELEIIDIFFEADFLNLLFSILILVIVTVKCKDKLKHKITLKSFKDYLVDENKLNK